MTSKYIEDLDRAYVSEYDTFLQAFDKTHPIKSASQQKEIDKHQRIAEKRDNALLSQENKDIYI